jgi:hypothetical protein
VGERTVHVGSDDDAPQPVSETGAAHALVIGIDRYRDPAIAPLRFARADAEAVRAVLTDPVVGLFHRDDVTLLLDEDATAYAIRTAVGKTLASRVAPGDTVVIYFAGHGAAGIDATVGRKDGLEKYLLPYDAEADNLRGSAIAMRHVEEDWFGWLEGRRVVFFLDCCYSGGAASGRGFDPPGYGVRAPLTEDYLDRLGEGRVVLTACAAREVSLETPALGHGLFTYYLLQGLEGAAVAGGDTRVTAGYLHDYVSSHVEEHARALGGRMTPQLKGAVQGRVYLTRSAGTPAPAPRREPTVRPRARHDGASRPPRVRTRRVRLVTAAAVLLGVTAGLWKLAGAGPPSPADGVYRVRVAVVDERDSPVDDASVSSDIGGAWRRDAGVYELTIPAGTLPASRRVVVRAERPSAYERARDSLTLGADANPTLTLRLRADRSASVHGAVVDDARGPVAGARVWVEGHEGEAVLTDASGRFTLPAHAADEQPVRVRAVKHGVGVADLHPRAGRHPVELPLLPAAPPR